MAGASTRRQRTGDLPRAVAHAPGCGTPRASRRARRRALALLAVHVLVALHVAHWMVSGTTLTPLEPSEAGETLTRGAINAGFVLLVLLVLSTLVLGRFFCGWACHVVAYQDACAWLLGKVGLRPKPVRSRLLVFVPLLAAFEMFALPSILRLFEGRPMPRLTWHLTSDGFWDRFPGPAMALVTFAVCGFVVVWFLGAKGFCTYGCPYGALFGLSDRFARGRIRVSDACEGCGHCTATCTSNVRVHEEVARFGMVVDPGCMKCMDCVDVCPKDALRFGFGPSRGSARRAARAASGRRAHDFGWDEEIGMAVVFLAALYAFRNLYDAVPFLLAVALAVLASAAAVTLVRLLSRADMRLQHVLLKRGRRLTAAGFAAVGLLPLYLAFAGHSAFVQYQANEGTRWLARAGGAERGSAAWREALDASAAHLDRAVRFGLADTSELRHKLGQLEVHRGNLGRAEEHLERALELVPESQSARVYLAQVHLARGELDRACARLEELFELDPADPFLRATLASLLRRDPGNARALALARRVRSAG